MGAAAFDDSFVFLFQAFEGFDQFIHRGKELIFYRNDGRNVHRGGKSIVGALAFIDIVVGVK